MTLSVFRGLALNVAKGQGREPLAFFRITPLRLLSLRAKSTSPSLARQGGGDFELHKNLFRKVRARVYLCSQNGMEASSRFKFLFYRDIFVENRSHFSTYRSGIRPCLPGEQIRLSD
jgi:hypothetical protein